MNYFLILCGGGLVSCTANTCTWDAHLRCEISQKRDCFTVNVLFNLIGFWTSQIKIFSLCGMSNQNFLSGVCGPYFENICNVMVLNDRR